MPIRQSKYIDISTRRAGVPASPNREFGARLFSRNELIPTGAIVTSSDADGVRDYFGAGSAEHNYAVAYFGFVSKRGQVARRIDFASYVNADVAPKIFGARLTQPATALTAITDGSFTITIGGTVLALTGLDLSTGGDTFAAVAGILQAAIRTGTGTNFTAATVTYEAVRGSFNFVGGETGAATIEIAAGTTGTDISASIGWRGIGAILSNGAVSQDPVDAVIASDAENDSFGSFDFIDSLSIDQVAAISEWNRDQNVKYLYFATVLQADVSTYNQRLIDNSGTGLILRGLNDFQQVLPMAVLGATRFDLAGASKNYMYQRGDFEATVTDTATSNALDALRINYVGQTQSNGQRIEFFQRGYLMGTTDDPTDMGIYANEMWFKSAVATALLNQLLSSDIVSANDQGRGAILGVIEDDGGPISQALLNGAFSVGRTLTVDERAAVTNITNDELAYLQVESIGYWIDIQITTQQVNGITENNAEYTLVYARDNSIRRVNGTHNIV